MTISGIALIVFILFSVAHLAAEAARSRAGRYFTKPDLLPVLALYYVASAAEPNLLLIAAMICCWLGDVFIMMPDPLSTHRYFKPAVTAVLLGHSFYIADEPEPVQLTPAVPFQIRFHFCGNELRS